MSCIADVSRFVIADEPVVVIKLMSALVISANALNRLCLGGNDRVESND